MSWRITRALGEQKGPDVDARLWLFELRRGKERRRIDVLITGQARLSNHPKARRAVKTSGESAVVDVLASIGDDEPPSRITVAATGIDAQR